MLQQIIGIIFALKMKLGGGRGGCMSYYIIKHWKGPGRNFGFSSFWGLVRLSVPHLSLSDEN